MIFDILELRDFYRAGFEATPENINELESFSKKGLSKLKQTFKEFFINNTPLSVIIKDFCGLNYPLTMEWIGALGPHSTKEKEKIKINQLLLKTTPESQIIRSYPPTLNNKYLKEYLRTYKEELEESKVMIYICGECGDFACGGISIEIIKTSEYFEWTYQNDEVEIINRGKSLVFRFDKNLYFEIFDSYIRDIQN